MKFRCDDFGELTHPLFCIAGCYGCDKATVGIDYVQCDRNHICTLEIVPIIGYVQDDSISCEYHRPKSKRIHQLCENCRNNVNNICKKGKDMHTIVVRLI